LPFDIIGWYESQAAAALTALAGVPDDVYRVSSDDIYVKQRAPWLIGSLHGCITQATLKYHEFRQPSLKIPYRFYKGVDLNDAFIGEGFNNLFGTPLPLYAGEKLNAYVQNATDEVDMVLAWLASGPAKISDIENVQPTHSITGYSADDGSAGIWADIAITWDQSLPKGRYAIVGMVFGSYIASGAVYGAARLKLLDTTWRPGVLVRQFEADKLGLASISPSLMYGERWPLMPEISFDHDEMPNVELLVGATMTDQACSLLLQKIG